jgi:hypothetical protein
MAKMNKKAILDAAKGIRPTKANYTFRLNEGLYGKFKEQCDKAGAKPTAVIEELLKEFLKQ